MPVTLLGVVYSKALAIRRRVIFPAYDDSEIDDLAHLFPGEGLFYMAVVDYVPQIINGQEVPGWNVDANLAFHLGTWPRDDRCAVIENDIIIAVISADPVIDSLEGKTLVLSEIANVGDSYIGGEVISPPSTNPIILIQPDWMDE